MKSFLDRIYRHIRPFRPLYGWLIDASHRRNADNRAKAWQARGLQGAKLDICGGRNPYKPGEYLNVDIIPLPQVDLVWDIAKQFPVENDVIAEIFSAATLEHLRKHDTDHVLKEFFRVLQPGGTVRILQPDIEAIARAITQKSIGLSEMNDHLFGKFKAAETDLYDLHKWMYPAEELMKRLTEVGFVHAERQPMDDRMNALQDRHYNFLIRAEKPA